VSRGQFIEQFLEWAGGQLRQWGMDPQPSLPNLLRDDLPQDPDYQTRLAAFRAETSRAMIQTLNRLMRQGIVDPMELLGRMLATFPRTRPPKPELTDQVLDRWLARFPNHPDLLRLRLDRWRATRPIGPEMISLLDAYASARSVDPMPQQMLAAIHLASSRPEQAIPYIESIDRLQKYDNTYAVELARLYQKQGRFDQSLNHIDRAVLIAPYDARLREKAAGIAIQAENLPNARRHLVALTVLEPDREQHVKRLEALDRMIAAGG